MASPGGFSRIDDDDPTSILKMVGDFRSKIRRLSSAAPETASKSAASASSIQQRLRFDDSSSFSAADDRSPMRRSLADSRRETSEAGAASNAAKKRSRYPSTEEIDHLRNELEKAKVKILRQETKMAESDAETKKSRNLVQKMEIQLKKARLEHEEQINRIRNENREEKSLLNSLLDAEKARKTELESTKKREKVDAESLRQRNRELAEKLKKMVEKNLMLEENLIEIKEELHDHKMDERERIVELKKQVFDLESELETKGATLSEESGARSELQDLQKEMEDQRHEMAVKDLKIEELKSRLDENREASVIKEAVKSKLDRFPELVKENRELKEKNRLLIETSENVGLLNARVDDLKDENSRLSVEVEKGQKAEEELKSASVQLNKWGELCRMVMNEEEMEMCAGQVSVDIMSQKIADLQRTAIKSQAKSQDMTLKNKLSDENMEQLRDENRKLAKDLSVSKNHVEQQASIIKRFKRKLLLVSKERDSIKGVLESYEHELTFSGGQFEKDRLIALEKDVQSHKETIEILEQELAKRLGVEKLHGQQFPEGRPNEEFRVKELQEQLFKVQEEKENLKMEMERRAIRGDFNPDQTMVLHLKDNPAAAARQEHEGNLEKLKVENEGLKQRVRLLEEGHSKDLTLLVGQKVKEGASSHEVEELRDQLKSKDLQKQRLLEAFQTTSQKFREVVYQLTGYRIDGLQNNQYRLSPIYAEGPDDYLLFRREESGECLLLETQFSAQLGELVELHLSTQNSIPVFLSALTMDLFSRQTFETVSHMETQPQETAPPLAPPQPPHQPVLAEEEEEEEPLEHPQIQVLQAVGEVEESADEEMSGDDQSEDQTEPSEPRSEAEEEEEEYYDEDDGEEADSEDENQGQVAQGDDDDPICIDSD